MKVSLIVPYRENDQSFQELLDTVANQKFKDFELILVKNGPEYKSDEKVVERLDNVKYKLVRSAKSSLGGYRNDGVELAEGEYVGFLDGDDLLSPYYLEELVYGAEKNPGAEIVYGFYTRKITELMTEKNSDSKVFTLQGKNLIPKLHEFDSTDIRLASVSGWGKLYKTNFIRMIPSVENVLFEDRAVAFEHMYRAGEIVIVRPEKAIYYYRITDGSIMNSSSNKHGRDILTASKMSVSSVIADIELKRIVQHEAVLFALSGQFQNKGISSEIKTEIWDLIKDYMHGNPYFTMKEKIKFSNRLAFAVNVFLSKVKKSVKN